MSPSSGHAPASAQRARSGPLRGPTYAGKSPRRSVTGRPSLAYIRHELTNPLPECPPAFPRAGNSLLIRTPQTTLWTCRRPPDRLLLTWR